MLRPHPYDGMSKQEIFAHLLEVNETLPEQRSPAWFAFRKNRITASSMNKAILYTNHELVRADQGVFEHRKKNRPKEGALIKGNPKRYTIEKVIVESDKKFYQGKAAKHGNTFEDAVVKIYNKRFNTEIYEFGCLPHPDIPFIAASPDGITPDGIMIEIKVPTSRPITGTPPIDYWMQMQQQMEVCGLDECDFLECKISKYDDFDDFNINDHPDPCQPAHINSCGNERGCVLKYFSADFPDTLNKTEYECLSLDYDSSGELVDNVIARINELLTYIFGDAVPDLEIHNFYGSDDHTTYQNVKEAISHRKFKVRDENGRSVIFKIKWWKLDHWSKCRVARDREWFALRYPDLEQFWKNVLIYRETGLPEPLQKMHDANVAKRPSKLNLEVFQIIDDDKGVNPKVADDKVADGDKGVNSVNPKVADGDKGVNPKVADDDKGVNNVNPKVADDDKGVNAKPKHKSYWRKKPGKLNTSLFLIVDDE